MSMRRWWRLPGSATPGLKRMRSRRGGVPARSDPTSRPERRRRTRTRAGRSSSQKPGPWRPASRASTSRSQALATRAACRSAGPSASSARARSPPRRALTEGCCAMLSPATTPRRMSGPTRPIGARPTRQGSNGRAGPAAEAARKADARTRRQGQCRKIEGPCPCRTRVRPAQGAEGAVYPHHRHQTRRGQDHADQPRLQHAPPDLPRATGSDGMAVPRTQKSRQKPAPC